MQCPFCGTETSIKDNERFSSLMCDCRILIFYYENCVDLVITKEEYIDYKRNQSEKNKKKSDNHFKKEKEN